MIASVYIKDGNIHFYNEGRKLTDVGGIAYELGRPLLDFICYEPERFDDTYSYFTDAFDNEQAHAGVLHPEFVAVVRSHMRELQYHEPYIFLYYQMFMEFVYEFIESPAEAIKVLERKLPGAGKKLEWAMGFEWPMPPEGLVFYDDEKRLHRAAVDVATLMSGHLKTLQKGLAKEVDLLTWFRENKEMITGSPMDYVYMLEVYHEEYWGEYIYLDNPYKTFYGMVGEPEIAELYVIDTIADLSRFEFVKMIEHGIFIKKCMNCGNFFMPRGRADTEFCSRTYLETGRKCNEIGAMLRYEKKVAGNPILEAHKRAYRRLHSRTRNKKMTQAEFLKWSDEASKKRDKCLAGKLPFDEFVVWLDKDRVRKPRGSGGN